MIPAFSSHCHFRFVSLRSPSSSVQCHGETRASGHCIRHCDSDVTDRSQYVWRSGSCATAWKKVLKNASRSARDVAFAQSSLSGDSGPHSGAPPGVCVGSVGLHGGRATYAFGRLALATRPSPCDRVCAVDQRQLGEDSNGCPPPVFDKPLFRDGTGLYFTTSVNTGASPAHVSIRGGEVAPNVS